MNQKMTKKELDTIAVEELLKRLEDLFDARYKLLSDPTIGHQVHYQLVRTKVKDELIKEKE